MSLVSSWVLLQAVVSFPKHFWKLWFCLWQKMTTCGCSQCFAGHCGASCCYCIPYYLLPFFHLLFFMHFGFWFRKCIFRGITQQVFIYESSLISLHPVFLFSLCKPECSGLLTQHWVPPKKHGRWDWLGVMYSARGLRALQKGARVWYHSQVTLSAIAFLWLCFSFLKYLGYIFNFRMKWLIL